MSIAIERWQASGDQRRSEGAPTDDPLQRAIALGVAEGLQAGIERGTANVARRYDPAAAESPSPAHREAPPLEDGAPSSPVQDLVGRPSAEQRPRPSGARAPLGRRHWLTSWPLRRALVAIVALAGISVMLAPWVQTWFADRSHDRAINGYARVVAHLPSETIERELREAHAYNKSLPRSEAIGDPNSDATAGADRPGLQRYLHTLDVDPSGVMGKVSIPAIGVDLPIYHGTAPDTLEKGIGHLFSTALPVGGKGTHAVLTGHSGVPGKTLFSDLDKLQYGDTFNVTVLDQTLTYRVDQIQTVLPDETQSLMPVRGKDYLTLVTCTPVGVNTHRLLVRGVRIPTPGGALTTPQQIAAGGPGFPWWILALVGTVGLITVATIPLAGKGRSTVRTGSGDGPPR